MMDAWALVAPMKCEGCGGEAKPPGLCASCVDDVPTWVARLARTPEGIDAAWALGAYASPVGALVRRAKYREDPKTARWLAARVVGGLAPLPVDTIVAVPPVWWKAIWRDVDVPGGLAAALATAWRLPQAQVLRRTKGASQARRKHHDRAEAARGAWRSTGPIRGHVLLVDDVLTTGTTASACARELRCAGASSVSLVVIGAAAAWSQNRDNVRKFATASARRSDQTDAEPPLPPSGSARWHGPCLLDG